MGKICLFYSESISWHKASAPRAWGQKCHIWHFKTLWGLARRQFWISRRDPGVFVLFNVRLLAGPITIGECLEVQACGNQFLLNRERKRHPKLDSSKICMEIRPLPTSWTWLNILHLQSQTKLQHCWCRWSFLLLEEKLPFTCKALTEQGWLIEPQKLRVRWGTGRSLCLENGSGWQAKF